LKRILKDYIQLVLIAGLIIALDQWTKYLVRTNVPFGEIWSPADWLTPFARVVHWKNTGAAFGMMQGYGIVFTILAILVSAAIIYYYPRVSGGDWYMRLALGMQLAGAVGNLIDRLIFGQVTDFISVGDFAVFNIADASITVGVAILLIGMWWKDRHDHAAAPTAPAIGMNHPMEDPDTDKKS
jgi:signal peptidase II